MTLGLRPLGFGRLGAMPGQGGRGDPLAPGAPGALTNQSANTDLTPTIRITLNAGAGVLANINGDGAELFANDASVGTATINGTDVSNGYVEITATTRPGTADTFMAKTSHAGGHVSPSSAGLAVTYVTAGDATAAHLIMLAA